MSLSLSKIADWLIISTTLLSIGVGTGLALWQGGKTPPEITQMLGQHPHFNYNFPLLPDAGAVETGHGEKTVVAIEPFQQKLPEKAEPEDLSLRELMLNLVVVSATDRYCLSNGTVMSEGQGSGRFTIDTITEEGVWYESSSNRFFLQVGERVYIDYSGKVHLENNTEPSNRQIDSKNDNI